MSFKRTRVTFMISMYLSVNESNQFAYLRRWDSHDTVWVCRYRMAIPAQGPVPAQGPEELEDADSLETTTEACTSRQSADGQIIPRLLGNSLWAFGMPTGRMTHVPIPTPPPLPSSLRWHRAASNSSRSRAPLLRCLSPRRPLSSPARPPRPQPSRPPSAAPPPPVRGDTT